MRHSCVKQQGDAHRYIRCRAGVTRDPEPRTPLVRQVSARWRYAIGLRSRRFQVRILTGTFPLSTKIRLLATAIAVRRHRAREDSAGRRWPARQDRIQAVCRIMRLQNLKGRSDHGEETAYGGTDHVEISRGGGPPGQGRENAADLSEAHAYGDIVRQSGISPTSLRISVPPSVTRRSSAKSNYTTVAGSSRFRESVACIIVIVGQPDSRGLDTFESHQLSGAPRAKTELRATRDQVIGAASTVGLAFPSAEAAERIRL